MSYAMGATALTRVAADRDLGWTKAKLHAYWNARAKACRGMADEDICLAQVAKHVPVTIGGLGDTAGDVSNVVSIVAGLLSDPEGTLRVRGPALVAAADRHVVGPLVQDIGQAMAPYALKYILPPLAILYVLTGISAYYSYHSAKRLKPNPSRRRLRRRTTRR
jgi:hypothetical protein